jgi:hypothetical protein
VEKRPRCGIVAQVPFLSARNIPKAFFSTQDYLSFARSSELKLRVFWAPIFIISMVEHCEAEHVVFYHGKASEKLKKELASRGVGCSTIEDVDITLP